MPTTARKGYLLDETKFPEQSEEDLGLIEFYKDRIIFLNNKEKITIKHDSIKDINTINQPRKYSYKIVFVLFNLLILIAYIIGNNYSKSNIIGGVLVALIFNGSIYKYWNNYKWIEIVIENKKYYMSFYWKYGIPKGSAGFSLSINNSDVEKIYSLLKKNTTHING